jgi:putative ABC transport system ATP-binding protein
MSGGENQRVAIARMIAKEPRLIFCDEPTSALDRENGALVADLLHRAAKTHEAVVLCVTHDDRLLPHADTVVEMEDGRLLTPPESEGSP